MRPADLILGGYQWYRRRVGGHWEQWWFATGQEAGMFIWMRTAPCKGRSTVYLTREHCEDH